jgi:MFS family permease
MRQEDASDGEATTNYTVLQRPLWLGSLALTVLPFLLPVYAKQLGASAVSIGGLFAVAHLIIVLLRPGIGWAIDRLGRKGFLVAGLGCFAGAMGLFAVADNVMMLYLAQSVLGLATALTWTSAYTITTELTPPAQQGKALGRVDEYAARGGFCGMVVALALLSWLALDTVWHLLFLGYTGLAVVGIGLAWTQVPETRAPSGVPAWLTLKVSWSIARVVAMVFLSYLTIAMIRPLFLVFLQDHITKDLRLLALAFFPAAGIESFVPSRLGYLSDRVGRIPLIIAGLAWAGLGSLLVPGIPHLPWLIVLWTLRTVGLTAAVPPQKALVSDMTDTDGRGIGYGLYMLAAGLGEVVGPLLGGWLYDAVDHATPFYLSGIVLLVSPGWVLLLLRSKPLRH